MSGYDTVVCAQPASFDGSLAWSKRAETVTGPTLVRRHLASLSEHVTVQHVEQRRDDQPIYSQLSVQASLPKVLWGHNVDELGEPLFVAQALGQVSVDLSAFLGDTIDLWSWRLQRVDVTCNRKLQDQALVAAALQRLAYVRYRGNLPVRGQAQSVTWPAKRGGFTKTCYSKLDEAQLAIADGVLRGEVRAHGQQAARRGWGRAEDASVLVADLMTHEAERARARVVDWTERAMGQAVEAVPMELVEAIEKMRRGSDRPSTVARLLGYAAMQQLVGEDYLVKSGFVSRQGAWKIQQEFKALGVDPLEIEFPTSAEGLAEIADDELDHYAADPAGFTLETVRMAEELDQDAGGAKSGKLAESGVEVFDQ